MKKLVLLIFAVFFGLYLSHITFAQTPNPSGQTTVNLTFPIPELGNCTSAQDCKAYCDDPTHIATCIDYAKQKGFYHVSSLDSQKDVILADAKATLGCNSIDSCKTFCADSAHADVCRVFAQRHNLKGGENAPDNITLEKAKTTLGCDNVDSCRLFCQQSENQVKCAVFAKENGLKGGKQIVGPGGCTSESSCKVFCSDPNNFQICSRFSQDHEGSSSGERIFKGPGGCVSEDSCRTFCSQNPTVCHLPSPFVLPRPSGPIPTEFHQGGMSLPSLSPQDYCRMYPSHCAGLTPTITSYPSYYYPTHYPTPYNNPTQVVTNTPVPDSSYTAYCQNKGCTFNGTTCICPTQTQNPNSNSGFTTSTPAPSPMPKLTGIVQGVATQRNFFQWLFDTIFHFR